MGGRARPGGQASRTAGDVRPTPARQAFQIGRGALLAQASFFGFIFFTAQPF